MKKSKADLDLEAIEARCKAATVGPWLPGSGRYVTAGVLEERYGVGKCVYCKRLGAPIYEGRMDINGSKMPAHTHKIVDDGDLYEPEHTISTFDGRREIAVTGNYDWEEGGVIDPVDVSFICHARDDVPALVAEVRRLRQLATHEEDDQ